MSHPLAPDVPELPNEYLLEIGHIVVGWIRLESLVLNTLAVAVLRDFDSESCAQAVLVHMSFPQKLQALGATLEIIDKQLAATYRSEVRGLLENAQRKRNSILHDRWFLRDGVVMRYSVSARRTLKHELFPVSLEELQEVHLFIDDTFRQFVRSVLAPLLNNAQPQDGQ